MIVIQGLGLSTLSSPSQMIPRPFPFLVRFLVMLLTGLGLLLIRFYVMGSTLPVFTNFDNPASYEEAPVKQFTFAYLIAVNR